jgi:hypothetical protein
MESMAHSSFDVLLHGINGSLKLWLKFTLNTFRFVRLVLGREWKSLDLKV